MYHTMRSTNVLEVVCSVMQRVGFVYKFICREPAMMHINDQGLTNLYGSVVFHI